MELGLKGRVFIIGGGSRGLGRATAEVLVSEGANVVIASRGVLKTEGTVLAEREAQVLHVPADLTDPSAADELVAAAKEKYQRIDGALLNAGGPQPGDVFDIQDGSWRAAFDSIFLAPLRLAKAVAVDVDRKAGALLFVLSTSVRTPLSMLTLSNGFRPGLAMVAKQMADELGPANIRVNGIMPGRIATARIAELDGATEDPEATKTRAEAAIPLRRSGKPVEFGRVATFLLSPAASYITGAVIPVDGGVLRSL